MKYNTNQHHRRSIRLKGYDYSQAGGPSVIPELQFCKQKTNPMLCMDFCLSQTL
ncbi:MAG: hypothetical protein ACP5D1_13380 [Bacteroidales bacterium]